MRPAAPDRPSPPRWASFRASLRAQILVPCAIGVTLLVVVLATTGAVVSRRTVDHEMATHATGVKRLFERSIDRRHLELERAAAAAAGRPGFARALARGDERRLARVGVPAALQRRHGYVAAFGLDGRGSPSWVWSEREVDWRPLSGPVGAAALALAGVREGGLAVSGEGRPVQYAAVPVRISGRTVGAVVVGTPLDERWIGGVGEPLDHAVWLETKRAGIHRDFGRPSGAEVSRTYRYRLQTARAAPGAITLALTVPRRQLARNDRSAIIIAAVGSVSLVLLLMLLIGALLDRQVARPLRGLRTAIREVRQGDFSVRLSLDGPRELREVADGFNRMVAIVERQRSRLEARGGPAPLTNVANNRRFHETLERELERARREQGHVSLLVLDVDHFKSINDAHGHPFGDEILRRVARELVGAVRTTDVVARVGGEEFAVVIPGADSALALAIGERARAAASALALSGMSLTCSAGLACYPLDAADAATLLEHADQALYAAKRGGRAQTRRYHSGQSGGAMSEEHYAELIDLLEREDALTPVFQPVVDLATGRLAGYEALSRFNAPVTRPPDQWFAHAHRCGLGPALEAKAVRAALASPDRPAGMFLCLNVSPSALASAEVREALPEDLTGLVIEITEQELFHDVERLNSLLVEMRARGARIALDDAGAGYAGLQAMMRVELDIIKLDRSLVDGIHSDLAKVALLESVVRFARRMGATVCAEGIETIEDLMVVADLDVTYGQGWVLARPAEPWVSLAPSVSQTLLRRSVRSHGEASGGPGMPESGDRRLEQLTARLSNVRSTEDLAAAWELVTAELGADEICFSTWHPDRGCVETLSEHDWMTVGETFAVAEYPGTRHVLETQEAAQVVAGDPEADPAEVELLTQGGYRSLLMVPVVHRGETVGLLEGYRTEERPWARSDINRARIIGYQLGAVLEGLPRSAPRSPAQVVQLASRRQTA